MTVVFIKLILVLHTINGKFSARIGYGLHGPPQYGRTAALYSLTLSVTNLASGKLPDVCDIVFGATLSLVTRLIKYGLI